MCAILYWDVCTLLKDSAQWILTPMLYLYGPRVISRRLQLNVQLSAKELVQLHGLSLWRPCWACWGSVDRVSTRQSNTDTERQLSERLPFLAASGCGASSPQRWPMFLRIELYHWRRSNTMSPWTTSTWNWRVLAQRFVWLSRRSRALYGLCLSAGNLAWFTPRAAS